MTVYVIVGNRNYIDRDNYRESDTFEHDGGYFTDKAKAQAVVDDLNTPAQARYALYVETVAKANKKAAAAHATAMRRYEILKAAGERTRKPDAPRPDVPHPFDYWIYDNHVTTYDLDTITRAAADED